MKDNFGLMLNLPSIVFTTKNRFNDYSTDDMHCGDLGDVQLQGLGLNDVSARVDPYRLIRYDTIHQGYRKFGFDMSPSFPKGTPISRQECKNILFDEMKELSTQFAYGQYAYLIRDMIDNFKNGNGAAYHRDGMDHAFLALLEHSSPSDTIGKIRSTINNLINGNNIGNYLNLTQSITLAINNSRLPKFNRREDNFNGLGITIHDIHAQEIKLMTLNRMGSSWQSVVFFKAQDHFGLDRIDITNPIFKQFRFFRIWFFLQRHKDYAVKPFFTNFSTSVFITGER